MNYSTWISITVSPKTFLFDVSDLLPTNLEIYRGLGETPQWIGRWTLQCPCVSFHGWKSRRCPRKVSHFEVPICGAKILKDLYCSKHDVERFSFCLFYLIFVQGLRGCIAFDLKTMAEVSARMQVPSGWWKLALVCNSLSCMAFPSVPGTLKHKDWSHARGPCDMNSCFPGAWNCFLSISRFNFISTARVQRLEELIWGWWLRR